MCVVDIAWALEFTTLCLNHGFTKFAYLVIWDLISLNVYFPICLLYSIERMKSHDICKNLLVLGWNSVHDSLLPFFYLHHQL